MKYRIYIGITLVALLMTACKKDEEDPYLEVWKQQNEQAFNNLANNPDFTELHLPGGTGSIYYRVIQQGTGKRLYYNSKAEVYFKGSFVVTNDDYGIKMGDIFRQRLFDDGVTFKIALSPDATDAIGLYYSDFPHLIEGWKIALQYMVEGDKWEICIPYQLAYGEKGFYATPDRLQALLFRVRVPGFSILAYELELIKAIDPNEF